MLIFVMRARASAAAAAVERSSAYPRASAAAGMAARQLALLVPVSRSARAPTGTISAARFCCWSSGHSSSSSRSALIFERSSAYPSGMAARQLALLVPVSSRNARFAQKLALRSKISALLLLLLLLSAAVPRLCWPDSAGCRASAGPILRAWQAARQLALLVPRASAAGPILRAQQQQQKRTRALRSTAAAETR